MDSHFVAFSSQQGNPGFPGVKDIDPQELLEKKALVTVVDVRRPDEFNGSLGHIPGAEHIVLDVLPQQINELSKDKTIVFVCLSGGRSAHASAFATENGFTSVYNLKGGMTLWNELGFATEGKNQK